MKEFEKIRSYYEANYPIIWLNTYDDQEADRVIRNLAEDRSIREWNLAQGWVDFNNRQPIVGEYVGLNDALSLLLLDEFPNHAIVLRDLVLFDDQGHENTLAVSRLRTLARRFLNDDDATATIFVISGEMRIPAALESFTALFDLGKPDDEEIAQQIREYVSQYGNSVDESVIKYLEPNFRGLGRQEISLILNRGYQQDGEIGLEDVELVIEEKAQMIRKSGLLELVHVRENIDSIGGLNNLTEWLHAKAKIMANLTKAGDFGVESPKGVMVVGMPGCGKSLTAKVTSKLFNLPLLRLDIGRLMGKYVGDSENNMRRALALAEDVSPCVLWIDELEKAFAGLGGGSGGGGGEVTSRLFGYFLTWMQEKSGAVFVIATANDVSALPPELLRRGRFDEIFSVNFPTVEERKKIFEVHIKKRRPDDVAKINFNDLVNKTDGFCGADIESVVKDAIEQAYVAGDQHVATSCLLEVIGKTRPLKVVMKDRIKLYEEKLRDFRPASEN